jgi:hypothetical protein
MNVIDHVVVPEEKSVRFQHEIRCNISRRAMSNRFDELEQLKNELKALLVRLPDDDAETINAALAYLELLGTIQGDFSDLVEALEEIDEQYSRNAMGLPDQAAELASATFSLAKVSHFLRIRYWSRSLDRLQAALLQLIFGGPAAAMLEPLNIQGRRGRRPDVPSIQSVKGALAGIMYGQQATGMSRQEAAAWIADNISPKLASRISSKPITARMVEEWLDRYGGNRPPDDDGGKAFKVWKRPFPHPPLTERKFREMTERIAETYPARKG